MSDKDDENRRLLERDLYAWSKATELLLFDRRIHEIDWDAVADELEKSAEVNDAHPMREAVVKLLTHLTIWNVSPDNRSLERLSEIQLARYKLDDILSRSPSLAGLVELEWKNLSTRARFAATLILGDRAALPELPTSGFALLTNDEPEAETASLALMRLSLHVTRLSLHVATSSGSDGDDSDDDHYAWCRAQATVARSREFDELDTLGIAEEILSAGTSVRRALIESLAGLLDKLMAWQAGYRSQGLKSKIGLDRAYVRALLWKNPSLALAPELVRVAHKFALTEGTWAVAAGEPVLSHSCTWTLAQVIDDASITERDITFTNATGASGSRAQTLLPS